jgi:hypothetical protein
MLLTKEVELCKERRESEEMVSVKRERGREQCKDNGERNLPHSSVYSSFVQY